MVEDLLKYEHDAFLILNGFHDAFFDQFMWLFSGKIIWLPLALSFIYMIFSNKKNWKQALLIVVAIAVVVTLCDQFASSVCKPLFTRFRPTHHPDFEEYVHTVFGYRGGRYGFISSHAANAFGFVTLTSLIFKRRSYTTIMFLWAFVTAYSRIYLGVHFITDIIPGIISGLLFGFIVYKLYSYAKIKIWGSAEPIANLYKPVDFKIFYLVMAITLLFLIVASSLYATDSINALTIK